MQLCYIQRVKEFIRLFKTIWRFTTTTYHDINTNESIGHGFLYKTYLIRKELTVIVSMHQT